MHSLHPKSSAETFVSAGLGALQAEHCRPGTKPGQAVPAMRGGCVEGPAPQPFMPFKCLARLLCCNIMFCTCLWRGFGVQWYHCPSGPLLGCRQVSRCKLVSWLQLAACTLICSQAAQVRCTHQAHSDQLLSSGVNLLLTRETLRRQHLLASAPVIPCHRQVSSLGHQLAMAEQVATRKIVC